MPRRRPIKPTRHKLLTALRNIEADIKKLHVAYPAAEEVVDALSKLHGAEELVMEADRLLAKLELGFAYARKKTGGQLPHGGGRTESSRRPRTRGVSGPRHRKNK